MKGIKLDPRLQEILSHISGNSFADIGCDHGKLAVAAVHKGIVKLVIATDISAPSLDKTKRLVESLGYGENILCRVGDGLKVVASGEVDTVVIAGLGGDEITKILQNMKAEKKTFSRYVLSPNTHAEKVRVEAIAQGLHFVRDYMISSGKKFYTVIVLECGETEKQPKTTAKQSAETVKQIKSAEKQSLSENQILFGMEYAQSLVFREWAEKEMKRIAKLINASENSFLLEQRFAKIKQAYDEC